MLMVKRLLLLLVVIWIAASLNFVRVASWLAGTPRAQTRESAYLRLLAPAQGRLRDETHDPTREEPLLSTVRLALGERPPQPPAPGSLQGGEQ